MKLIKPGVLPVENTFVVNVMIRKSLYEAFEQNAADYGMTIQELLQEVAEMYSEYIDYTLSPKALNDPDSEIKEYDVIEKETVAVEIPLTDSLLEKFYEAAINDGITIEELISNFLEEYYSAIHEVEVN